jgi:mono/diheme cytochrome c family protein
MRAYNSRAMWTPRVTLLGAALTACAVTVSHPVLARQGAAQPSSDDQQFEASVRPIFATHCYDCHTVDTPGMLRLDSREGMLKGGKSGPAIVPGDADASLLMKAIRHATGVRPMPMQRPRLSDAEIATLGAWIQQGARWPATSAAAPAPVTIDKPITAAQRAFWSFTPLASHATPSVADAAWVQTDIDRFVLARLEKEGLKPVRTAGRRALIRRASLDLTGLPPTPEDIDAFEKDTAPDAFERVIDRLLASPRYGEHWGRWWLDVARYGEDDPRSLDPMRRGHNPYPHAYLYRDWVVKALNDDLPYDLFVKAQLAADQLDEPQRARMLPALGLLGLGPWYYDNGAVEITRADERHDRVDVVTRGFLGLTVACARCHDHKYDPIPTKDYYAISGVFLNSVYTEYPRVPEDVAKAWKAEDERIERKEKLLEEFMRVESRQLGEALALQSSRYMLAAWRVTGEQKEDLWKVAGQEKLDFELLDRWVKFLAKPPKFYAYLKPWQAMIAAGGTNQEAKKLADEFQTTLVDVMFRAKETDEENDIIRAKALPGTKKKKLSNKPHEFVTNDDFCPGCGLELKSLPNDEQQLWTDVFQRDLQDGFDPAQAMDDVRPGLLVFRGWGLEQHLSADRQRYISALREDISAARKALGDQYQFVHGVRDAETIANLKVSLRGSPYRLGEEVPRRFLSVLSAGPPAPFTHGSGRLDLADAILAQPIAMRVIVNRVWKGPFGTGIVDTASNFGFSGERPVHPELLEYLAQRFVSGGRSLKALHKEIMLSRVYQLASDDVAANRAKDAGNRFYWRANRRRMTAEQIRDSVLFAAGALDETIGGPPAALTPFSTRRTIYGAVSRYKTDDYLRLFDVPSPTISAEQRFTTNVPLQRLFFMNSDFLHQYSEQLARHVSAEADSARRIAAAYRRIFGRAPTDAETKAGLAFLASEPMKAYAERKASPPAKTAPPAVLGKGSHYDNQSPAMRSDGMMGGVERPTTPEDQKKLLPMTALGRYLKILLTSNEFVFID